MYKVNPSLSKTSTSQMTDTIIETSRAKQLENSEPPTTELENLNLMPTPSVLNERQLGSAPQWSISEFESMKKLLMTTEVTTDALPGQPFVDIVIDNVFIKKYFTEFLSKKFGLMSCDMCFEIYIQSHYQQVGAVILATTNARSEVLQLFSGNTGSYLTPATLSKLPSVTRKLGHSWTENIKIPWQNFQKFTGTGYTTDDDENFFHSRLLIALLTPFRTEGLPKFTVRVYTYLQNLQYSAWQP